jgi:8-amino-3,8-dideoxy-alpha-D-manno-octulosonate transaminase
MDLEQVKQILASAPPEFYGANVYDEQEIAAAVRVVYNQSPFRFYGRKCTFEARQFEEEAAAWYGVKHACTTNSGSGALMLALHALDVGPGCEVVVPAYFWIAVSNTILLRGGIPVLCEIDDTLNMDPADLARKIGPKTKAVVTVHMCGGQADMTAIAKVCRERRVPLVEDFSQCNGGAIGGRKLGSFGDIGITSLQLNKAITSGEGGLLLTNDAACYEKAAARSDMGYPRSGGVSSAEAKSSYVTVGEGRRFNEIAAAIMRVQLAKLPAIAKAMLESKRAIEAGMRPTVDCRPRKVVDPAGDLGSTQTIVFAEPSDAEAFSAAWRRLFGNPGWFAGLLKDTGLHVYYNCSNLVRKLPVLPGGFPWNLDENRGAYRYEKGTCPATDALLARSVGMGIPPDLDPVHVAARIEALNLAFREMRPR